MARMHEKVFTDADFDNRVHNKAKPGEIWSKVNELSEMFESVKKEKNDKNRRMNENIMSFNGRPRTSFNQVNESADVVEINGVKYQKLSESASSRKNLKEDVNNDVVERAIGFERELNEIVKKYGIVEICPDRDELHVGFGLGDGNAEWLSLYGIDKTKEGLTFDLDL